MDEMAKAGDGMDFLQAASLFVPALTGLTLKVYNGEPEILAGFEKQFCFSVGIQSAFTASELDAFFRTREENFIYEIIDSMEIHLIVFKAGDNHVLLGPFVEEKWNEGRAKQYLAKHGADAALLLSFKMYYCQLPIFQQNYVMQIAGLILEKMGEAKKFLGVRTVYTCEEQGSPVWTPVEAYEETSVINRRYYMEGQLIEAISRGETKEALKFLHESKKLAAGLRFVSENMKGYVAGAAIVRTIVRMGAVKAGLAPVVIDSISQEYAQQMQNIVSDEKLNQLLEKLVAHFCRVIREERKNNYSIYVKKAIDYMSLNMSRQITIDELAEAAGLTRSYFVKMFGEETGMTVKQYLARKRCETAAGLLADSGLSIQQIAAYVGYTDNNYFSKVFKANMGISPQDYRKNYGCFF